MGDMLKLIGEVGFPIAGALAAGYFVFLTLRFILEGVTGTVNGLAGIIKALDNRVQTMNNDLVKIDALMSYALKVKPNIDRLAANEGNEDLEEHPWLTNYRSKNQIEKIEILTEALKGIETNLGYVSVLSMINSVLIIGLIIGALVTGVVGISSEVSDALIGFAKDKIGLGE